MKFMTETLVGYVKDEGVVGGCLRGTFTLHGYTEMWPANPPDDSFQLALPILLIIVMVKVYNGESQAGHEEECPTSYH